MPLLFRSVLLFFVFFTVEIALAKQEVKVLGLVKNAHVGQLFFNDFISLLWEEPALEENYELIEIAEDGYRLQRLDILLTRKALDIAWLGAETRLNANAVKVPLPVVAGLLGYRIALIRDEDKNRFNKISDLEGLKAFRACQGASWLDADILEYNGIPVARVSNSQSMVKMLAQGRCDMFPRGIQEAAVELQDHQKQFPTIVMNKSVIMHYEFASYLYVRSEDISLAERLEKAFRTVIADGRYQHFIETHDYTKHVFPLSQWQSTRFIQLGSPDPDPNVLTAPNYINLRSQ